MSTVEKPVRLTDEQQRVLEVLNARGGPMATVDVAALADISVTEAVRVLHELLARGLVEQQAPEPAHERYQLDRDALARAAG